MFGENLNFFKVMRLSFFLSFFLSDAFVKGIYGKMFIWIVEKINSAIYKPKDTTSYRKR
jgi:myosin-7